MSRESMSILSMNHPRVVVFTPHFCEQAVRGVWRKLREAGLLNLCSPGLQFNAGHATVPRPTDDLRVSEMYDKHLRDWIPGAAGLHMWDCEPANWIWDMYREGMTDADHALIGRMMAMVYREKLSRGDDTPMGLWGLPHTDGAPATGLINSRHFDDAVAASELCDYIVVHFYPSARADAYDAIGPHNDHLHRARVRNTIEGLRTRTRKPLVPMLWLHGSHDNAPWFRVYLDELASLGVSLIALWGDCQTIANGRNVERAIEQVVPAIGSWARKVHVGRAG